MKTIRQLLEWLLDQNPLAFLIGFVVYLLVLSYIDYILIGGHLARGGNFTKTQTIAFYFGRSLSEHLMLLLGIILGWKFCHGMGDGIIP